MRSVTQVARAYERTKQIQQEIGEVIADQRAQRGALLASLDRLGYGGAGPATA